MLRKPLYKKDITHPRNQSISRKPKVFILYLLTHDILSKDLLPQSVQSQYINHPNEVNWPKALTILFRNLTLITEIRIYP